MSQMVGHNVSNDRSIDDTNPGGSNGFTASGHILAPNIAPNTQTISDLSLGSSGPMRHHHTNTGTNLNVSISHFSPWISVLIYVISLITLHSLQVMPWYPPPSALPKMSQTPSMTRSNLRS